MGKIRSTFIFIILIPASVVCPFTTYASASDVTEYFAGTSTLSATTTGTRYPSERILLKKTVSQTDSRIVEIACTQIGGQYRQSPVYMTINENHITVADTPSMRPGLLEGTGFVFGTPWKWEYLVLDMKTKFGGRTVWIHDVNLVTDQAIHAIKTIHSNIGTNDEPIKNPKPDWLMVVEVKQIDQAQYLREFTQLGCSL